MAWSEASITGRSLINVWLCIWSLYERKGVSLDYDEAQKSWTGVPEGIYYILSGIEGDTVGTVRTPTGRTTLLTYPNTFIYLLKDTIICTLGKWSSSVHPTHELWFFFWFTSLWIFSSIPFIISAFQLNLCSLNTHSHHGIKDHNN